LGIEAVWGVEILDERDNVGPYFERTAALGFGSRLDYERDLADPKWLAKLVATLSAAGQTAEAERVRAVVEQLRRGDPGAAAARAATGGWRGGRPGAARPRG